MVTTLSAGEMLARRGQALVVDVRTPGEFVRGHIPGAVNIPLFSDEERAIVGTTYTRINKEAALLRGLEFAGKNLALFVKEAGRQRRNRDLIVHCWRGGMRSRAMGWLLDFAGFPVFILEGGYKAYRTAVHALFDDLPPLVVLGGYTGSGKTKWLRMIQAQGQQVLDLEGLACHKGSVFGSLGQDPQPTTEQFENRLADFLLVLDRTRPLWIEDESLKIGTVNLPLPLFRKMKASPVLFMNIATARRVAWLTTEYALFDPGELVACLEKISKRMGFDEAGRAVRAVQEGRMEEAIGRALAYYDQTYRFGVSSRTSPVHEWADPGVPEDEIPGLLVEFARARALI